MEQTFMTIHNLCADANVLFASDSITDILGYQPHEVQNKSCFDFFHPDEIPFARSVHNRGVLLDKAAVLHYARIRSRDGSWISCECCFTVVHDVLVACTSIYRKGQKSDRRALEAPHIRRIFSCSPRDPRYHMLEHLSPKFRMAPMGREPRAALILNRFTVSLSIMFATNAVAPILGIRADQIKNKSFYDCIQENCLTEAVGCLESAKANDSIAYLRFWYKDPRRDEDFAAEAAEEGEEEDQENNARSSNNGSDKQGSSDSEGGGAELDMDMDLNDPPHIKVEDDDDDTQQNLSSMSSSFTVSDDPQLQSVSHSGQYQTPVSTVTSPRSGRSSRSQRRRRGESLPSVELEAVVSCTSDGLVVVLRRARPPIPAPHPPLVSPTVFENGLFAAPWGQEPIRPHDLSQCSASSYSVGPPISPHNIPLRHDMTNQAEASDAGLGGPPTSQLMRSIRDVAVFAWAIIGINGNLAQYGRGLPQDEAQPPDGLPIWDPKAGSHVSYLGPENQASTRWAEGHAGPSTVSSTASAVTRGGGNEVSSGRMHNRQQPHVRQLGHGLGGHGSHMGDNYTYNPSSGTPVWAARGGEQQGTDAIMHNSYATPPQPYVPGTSRTGYQGEQRFQTAQFGDSEQHSGQSTFGEQHEQGFWGRSAASYPDSAQNRQP